MELGARIRRLRLEKGLSQRQLCGDVITRNMLSQIENGTAKPSMDTLLCLAARLEKPVSYFLEEPGMPGAQQLLVQARRAFQTGNWAQLGMLLETYQGSDERCDTEFWLLRELWLLHRAEDALRQERRQYVLELLTEAENAEKQTAYGALLERQRMLLRAAADPETPMPPEDDAFLLRARRALEVGQLEQCAGFLEACEKKSDVWWQLWGELELCRGRYAQAAQAFHRVETPALYGKLEMCYRQLENYQKAYEYACKQREG